MDFPLPKILDPIPPAIPNKLSVTLGALLGSWIGAKLSATPKPLSINPEALFNIF